MKIIIMQITTTCQLLYCHERCPTGRKLPKVMRTATPGSNRGIPGDCWQFYIAVTIPSAENAVRHEDRAELCDCRRTVPGGKGR